MAATAQQVPGNTMLGVARPHHEVFGVGCGSGADVACGAYCVRRTLASRGGVTHRKRRRRPPAHPGMLPTHTPKNRHRSLCYRNRYPVPPNHQTIAPAPAARPPSRPPASSPRTTQWAAARRLAAPSPPPAAVAAGPEPRPPDPMRRCRRRRPGSLQARQVRWRRERERVCVCVCVLCVCAVFYRQDSYMAGRPPSTEFPEVRPAFRGPPYRIQATALCVRLCRPRPPRACLHPACTPPAAQRVSLGTTPLTHACNTTTTLPSHLSLSLSLPPPPPLTSAVQPADEVLPPYGRHGRNAQPHLLAHAQHRGRGAAAGGHGRVARALQHRPAARAQLLVPV